MTPTRSTIGSGSCRQRRRRSRRLITIGAKTVPDPSLTQMDIIAMGADAVRHPLLGCVIANNGTPPIEQARDYLRSLRDATINNVTGRSSDMSDNEFRDWMLKLEAWHKTNSVDMPTPNMPADHRLHRR